MSLFLSGTVNGEFQSWVLDRPRLVIGRASKNDIQIADATISKEHAEIIVESGRARIRDLGSRNGTRVNGIDAREALAIQPGDRVEIGHLPLAISVDAPSRPLALNDRTVLGSSHRIKLDHVLERRTQDTASARAIVHLLAEAGQMLVLPRPLKETCEQVLEIAAKAVPASRYVILLERTPGADPEQIAARMAEGMTEKPLILSRTIMRTVLDECSSVLTADAASDIRFAGNESIIAQAVHSAMAVPLFDNERVLGLIYVDRQERSGTFSQEQLELFTLLANMAAVKIRNAQLLESERASQQLAQQFETAAAIQRGLLPGSPPTIEGWEFDTLLESCYAVGGDLYDFHRHPDGRLVFVVGDVSGKGLGAALLMSSMMSAARVLYPTCRDVAELANQVSAAVYRNSDPGRFITGVIGCIDPATGSLHYVNAGHPPPCIIQNGSVTELEATGVPLGILPEFRYESRETTLPLGAMLAVFSDGIPEAQHGEEFFDNERVHEALKVAAEAPDLAAARRTVLERVDAFTAGEGRSDDVTLFLARRKT
jgi:serine phosphatase RsbU (regulator of sigma subunit)